MKKLFAFLFALACFAGMNAREVYLVGDATTIGWDAGKALQMKEVSTDVFEWTGVLYGTGSQEGFKLLTQKDWNPAIHPSTPVWFSMRLAQMWPYFPIPVPPTQSGHSQKQQNTYSA